MFNKKKGVHHEKDLCHRSRLRQLCQSDGGSRRKDRGRCLRRGQLYDPEDDRGIFRGRRSQEGHEGRAEGL